MTRIRKGVITAAGRGTRLLPATRTVQKELFPLVDVDGRAKPIIQILVEELTASGIEEICIVANTANIEPMRRHFAEEPGAAKISFAVQATQEGYGHAVFQARDWVGGEPFVLTLGDHVYFSERAPERPPRPNSGVPDLAVALSCLAPQNWGEGASSEPSPRCTRQVMDAFEANGCSVSSVFAVAEASVTRYGIIAGMERGDGLYSVRAMAEKPTAAFAQSNLRTVGLPDGHYLSFFGIHAFTPTIFDCLAQLIDTDKRERGEFQLTSAQELLFAKEDYLLSKVAGVRCDMGVPEGLIETQIALALRSPFAGTVRGMLTESSGQRVQ